MGNTIYRLTPGKPLRDETNKKYHHQPSSGEKL